MQTTTTTTRTKPQTFDSRWANLDFDQLTQISEFAYTEFITIDDLPATVMLQEFTRILTEYTKLDIVECDDQIGAALQIVSEAFMHGNRPLNSDELYCIYWTATRVYPYTETRKNYQELVDWMEHVQDLAISYAAY